MAVPTVTTQVADSITSMSFDGNGEVTLTGGEYDIDNLSSTHSISSQDSFPTGIAWNNDGTKMYESGRSAGQLHEYDVSTPYDISTATLSESINSESTGSLEGIAWNNDGTKLYDRDFQYIHEYDVSTPFDITTATYSQRITGQGSYSFTWNNDGTKLYESGFQIIYESNVSTAYDISTASFNTSISSQDNYPIGIAWNNDGTKLYEMGDNLGTFIYEYNVSTPFDISIATFSKSVSANALTGTGIVWNNDGSKFYESDNNGDLIFESDVGVAITERGFVYSTTSRTDPGNTSPAASAYESVESEGGTFSTGTFSLSITGLTGGTTYYVRSYSENSDGYSYGDEVQFTTLSTGPNVKVSGVFDAYPMKVKQLGTFGDAVHKVKVSGSFQ